MRNAIDPTVMDALENGGRLDPERLTAAALAELHGAEALDETRREGRAIEHCRRLRVDVIQAAPDGLGEGPAALKKIAEVSNRYLDELAYWRKSGDFEVGAAVQPGGTLYNDVVEAWREAGGRVEP